MEALEAPGLEALEVRALPAGPEDAEAPIPAAQIPEDAAARIPEARPEARIPEAQQVWAVLVAHRTPVARFQFVR